MTDRAPPSLRNALERAGWPVREFRSHSAALLFAFDYLEQQQANGVSRASLHKEFEDLGFRCSFNTFAVSLKRARAKKKANRNGTSITGVRQLQRQELEVRTPNSRTGKETVEESQRVFLRPHHGEITGFVSSTKNNSDKLREELI